MRGYGTRANKPRAAFVPIAVLVLSASQILRYADEAMYKAKWAGRSHVR